MKKNIFQILPLLGFFAFASCDDGTIEKEIPTTVGGKIIKVEGNIQGLKTWSERYDISVAGFTEDANTENMPYATISKVMSVDSNGHYCIVLSNISNSVKNIEICALNRLRQRIITFSKIDISNEPESDTIRYDFGTIDASMYAGIQKEIFNASCTACHGANGTSADGLNLTEGNSYNMLVNHPSTQLPEYNRITPGNADKSVIWQVIYGNASENWPMNHGDMLNKDRSAGLLQMLEDWINDGANI